MHPDRPAFLLFTISAPEAQWLLLIMALATGFLLHPETCVRSFFCSGMHPVQCLSACLPACLPASVLSVACLCSSVLSLSCLYPVSVLSLSCLCPVSVCFLSVSCLFSVSVLSVSCLCPVCVLSVSCLCLALASPDCNLKVTGSIPTAGGLP